MTFGYSPNQLTFAEDNKGPEQLLTVRRDFSNTKEYMEKLRPYVDKIRCEHKKRKDNRIRSNLSYINKKRSQKNLAVNDVVLLQNLHLSAGRGMKAIASPGIIIDVCKSGNAALVQSLLTERVVKYNFTYLKKITKPLFAQLPETWQIKVREATGRDTRNLSSQDSELIMSKCRRICWSSNKLFSFC